MARALAKFRINPGNVGFGDKRDRQFELMVEAALRFERPVRIGVNWGSLDQDLADPADGPERGAEPEPQPADFVLREALVRSALDSAAYAERLGLGADRIVISAKVSRVQDLVAVYRELARRSAYALHVGLTEAGMGIKGIAATAAGAGAAAAGGHRRHHPRLADAAPGRAAHQRGRGLPGGAAVAGPALVHAAGRRPARAAAGPPARCSRSWPTGSRPGCASRCRSGSSAIPAWRA